MKKTASEKFRLGLFVIIGSVLFVAVIYFIGQKQNVFGQTVRLNAVFSNVNGLQTGNNVRYSGIDIGAVRSIDMINDTTIIVNMAIETKMLRHIRKNAIATISSDGLVGSMIINIIPGKGDAEIVSHADTIKSYSRIRTDDILKTLNVTNENAALLTVDLLKITKEITEGKGSIGVLLNDKAMAAELKQTIHYLSITSKETSQSVIKLNRLISSLDDENNVIGVLNDTAVAGQIRTVVANLDKSSEQIDKAAAHLDQTILNIKDGDGAINYLSNNPELVGQIDSLMTNANDAAKLLKQDLEALKHNFFLRGYFKKLEKQKTKKTK